KEPPDRDLHLGIDLLGSPQLPQVAVEFVVGVLPDRTRVEHDEIRVTGRGTTGDRTIPRLLELPRQPFGVVHVHLTTERTDLITVTCSPPSRVRGLFTGHDPRIGMTPSHGDAAR